MEIYAEGGAPSSREKPLSLCPSDLFQGRTQGRGRYAPRVARRLLLPLLFAALLASASAWAHDRAAAESHYARAKTADDAFAFEKAQRAYQEAFEADPSAPFARVARMRAQWLEERKEGDYAPLVELERVRRDANTLSSLERIDAFARRVDAFPPGRTQVEGWMTVADAYRLRVDRPDLAAGVFEKVVASNLARPAERELALDSVVSARLESGDLNRAIEAVDRWGEVAPRVRDRVWRLRIRRFLEWASLAVLGVALFAGLVAAIRLKRAGNEGQAVAASFIHPYALPFALYIAGVGALCVRNYHATDPRPFLFLGAGVVVLAGIGRAWRMASRTTAARWGFGAFGLAAVLSLAFLALSQSDPAYLEGFGL